MSGKHSSDTEDKTEVFYSLDAAVIISCMLLLVPTIAYTLLFQPSYLLLVIISIIFSVTTGYLIHFLLLKNIRIRKINNHNIYSVINTV